jgi:signal transduction histidine kinase
MHGSNRPANSTRETSGLPGNLSSTRASRALVVGTIAVALLLSWAALLLAGGAEGVAPQWFLVPIIVGGFAFGGIGGAVTGLVAGILVGLMPADIGTGQLQSPLDWFPRGLAFIAMGALIGAMARRLETTHAKESALIEREREFTATKAAVLSTISHEFRTPLTVILGGTQTLERLGDRITPDAKADLVHSMGVSAAKLQELISSVLAVTEPARDTCTEREMVDLTEIAASVIAGLPGWDRRVNVRIDDDARLVVSDPALLRLSLAQLVDNALKFSPADQPVEITASLRGRGVELSVRDRGPGIDPWFLDEAMQPFTQGDASATRRHGGLGLGLHLVRRLCDVVGADLRLLPRPGGGTDAVIHIRIGGRAADVRGGDIDLSVESIVAGRSPDPIVSVKSAPPS